MKTCLSSVGESATAKWHFTYKPQTKGVSQERDTKETCPYWRHDGSTDSRQTQPATPHKRQPHALSVSGSLASCLSPKDTSGEVGRSVSEKVKEARRDWKVVEFEELNELTAKPRSTPTLLTRYLSQCNFEKDNDSQLSNMSTRSGLSSQTLRSVTAPIHSVRARPSEARPRWR